VRRHFPEGFALPPREVVDRLADHFLRVTPAGVTWVHPSWRDLVIDTPAADGGARRTFLHAASLDGVALALSTAGGSAGERDLPLLREDADWDALGDRLALLVPELGDVEAARLLAMLAEARSVASARVEVEALADSVLERLSGARTGVVGVSLLEAWFALASELAGSTRLPAAAAAATWIDLAPGAWIDASSPEEVAGLDEWLLLAEVLAADANDLLDRLGFTAHVPALGRFVAATRLLAVSRREPLAHRELLVRVLRRCARLVPTAAGASAHAISALLDAAPIPELPPAPAYRHLSAELEQILDAPPVPLRSDEALVRRVLRDL
jgi:hypothetical protein